MEAWKVLTHSVLGSGNVVALLQEGKSLAQEVGGEQMGREAGDVSGRGSMVESPGRCGGEERRAGER